MRNKSKGKAKRKSKIQKFIEPYKVYYDRIIETPCPSLKKNVSFTSDGWRHITDERENSDEDIKSKVTILFDSVQLLNKSKKYEFQNKNKIKRFKFTGKVSNNRVISVIVMLVDGKFQFRTNWIVD